MKLIMQFLLVAIALLFVNLIFAQTPRCSREQAMQADSEASTLSDWDAIKRSFIKFRNCDDGGISEGYSESVSRLLAEHWKNTVKLIVLTKNDAAFEAFVIKHIDETVPSERLKQIIINAREHCPDGGTRLCLKLENAAK